MCGCGWVGGCVNMALCMCIFVDVDVPICVCLCVYGKVYVCM